MIATNMYSNFGGKWSSLPLLSAWKGHGNDMVLY